MTGYEFLNYFVKLKFHFLSTKQEVLVKCQSYRPRIRSEAGMNERVTLIFFLIVETTSSITQFGYM